MNLIKFSLTLGALTLLAACGGGSGSGSSLQVGQFIDDPVAGLTYNCVNGTQTNTGTTNDSGQFNYQPGQTCTFKVGNVTLGTMASIPSDGKVTPQDVAGVSRAATSAPSALAVAQFLQSLNDGSTSGKIVIPTATSTALNNAPATTLVSSTGAISQTDLQNIVVNVAGKTLISAASAKGALDTQISQGNVSTASGSVSPTAPVALNSIVVTSAVNNNAAGLTEQLTATGYYSNGTSADITSTATWSSSDASKLTVSSTGVATGLKKGTATVTASLKPAGASVSIVGTFAQTTADAILQSITVTNSANLPAGRTDQLTSTGNYSDGTTADLTSSVSWSSADTSKVTINTSGLATGVAKGSSTITASFTPAGSSTAITGTFAENVLDPTITNLIISFVQSGLTSIQKTATAALNAVVNLSNNTTQTVSSFVNWVVTSVGSSTGAGTIATSSSNNSAILTGTTEGNVNISASYQGLTSNTLQLTVKPLTTISGVAASGIAMSGSTITAQCQGASSAVIATAANDGSYSMTLPAGTYSPCILSASKTDNLGVQTTYYSAVASDTSDSTPIANITPLTHLIVTNATGSVPSTSTSLQSVASQLTSSALSTATTLVQSTLSSALGVPSSSLTNPLSSTLTVAPADSGVPPSLQDAAIDQVMASLNVSSTSLSSLANSLTSQTSVAATSAVRTLASQNGIPTSASGTCPFATSGLYATANVGSTNLNNGVPNFGFLKIDFSNNTAVNGSGEQFSITQPNANNPCQFRVASSTKYINFQVSRSGFIVATSFDPPSATASSPSMMTVGTGSDCFKPNSYCSGFQLGFPVQTGLTLNDMLGTWQSAEWNLDQYQYANSSGASNGSSTPCSGLKTSTSLSSSICSIYVSFARRFVVASQAPNVTMNIYDCDGLGQGGQTGTATCSSTKENSSNLIVKMCSANNDCPVVSFNGTSVTLTSVVDVIYPATGTVVSRSLSYRAPNNDLIGFFVSGQGGPANNDGAHALFGGVEFQEQFGVIFRPSSDTVPPTNGSTVNNPQWNVTDWGSGIQSATITGTTMSNVTLTAGANPLTAGQLLFGSATINGSPVSFFRAGTSIFSVNTNNGATTYTLTCGGVTDCRTDTTRTSYITGTLTSGAANIGYSNLMAFGFQVKEATQVYTVSNLTSSAPYSFTRTFSDTIDQGQIDQVILDRPYAGMSYRAYVSARGTSPSMNESTSLRGAGFSISIGTATVAQQLGFTKAPGVGPNQSITTGCTMPGQVITYSSTSGYGCDSTGRSTGKFFTVNLKY